MHDLMRDVNQYIIWCLINLTTSIISTTSNRMALAHLKKRLVIAKINHYPLYDGGVMGPIITIPHVSNGQVVAVACKYFRA